MGYRDTAIRPMAEKLSAGQYSNTMKVRSRTRKTVDLANSSPQPPCSMPEGQFFHTQLVLTAWSQQGVTLEDVPGLLATAGLLVCLCWALCGAALTQSQSTGQGSSC